jgi:hypothetical protein
LAQSKNVPTASSKESPASPQGEGAPGGPVADAMARLNRSLDLLEDAISVQLERELETIDATAEVQRMGADRTRLALSLDEAEARSRRLESANREVSRRLVGAMEAIRAVLDREN